ncbi:MAG: hypothetical protein ACFN1I_09125 [Selenomonas artemidis]
MTVYVVTLGSTWMRANVTPCSMMTAPSMVIDCSFRRILTALLFGGVQWNVDISPIVAEPFAQFNH